MARSQVIHEELLSGQEVERLLVAPLAPGVKLCPAGQILLETVKSFSSLSSYREPAVGAIRLTARYWAFTATDTHLFNAGAHGGLLTLWVFQAAAVEALLVTKRENLPRSFELRVDFLLFDSKIQENIPCYLAAQYYRSASVLQISRPNPKD
jgi:hypothetical protein